MPKLDNRTSRTKLPMQKKPYWQEITPGVSLGYRRNKGAGVWLYRVADGKGGNRFRSFAKADDVDVADNNAVLNYKQAHARAGQFIGSKHASAVSAGAIPATVDEAIDAYETDLETRGGRIQNAKSIRFYLTDFPILRAMPVSLLKKKDLKEGLARQSRNQGRPQRQGVARYSQPRLACIQDSAQSDRFE